VEVGHRLPPRDATNTGAFPLRPHIRARTYTHERADRPGNLFLPEVARDRAHPSQGEPRASSATRIRRGESRANIRAANIIRDFPRTRAISRVVAAVYSARRLINGSRERSRIWTFRRKIQSRIPSSSERIRAVSSDDSSTCPPEVARASWRRKRRTELVIARLMGLRQSSMSSMIFSEIVQ